MRNKFLSGFLLVLALISIPASFVPRSAYASCLGVPTVTTSAATDVLASTAIGMGNLVSTNGHPISARGVAWSLSANPTISDSVETDTATSTGAYAVNLNNLNATTLYHFRAFATSCGGTAYGSDLTFTTNAAATVIFLTTTGANTWSVPSDWNSSANSIEIVGGGASAGGGGGYAKATNVSLTPGGTVGYQISPGGATTTGGSGGISAGDTYFCNSTSNCASIGDTAVKVGAKGGLTASNG